MVTRAYFDGEEPPFRRFNGRGQLYSLSHPERELPPAPHHNPYVGSRNQQTPSNEVRNGESTPEQDTNQHPRRRIPVACGRCRKRKIRCSGDPGSGQPCSNCKSAGNEHCQFLRVSSTEAQMKTESADFHYDPGAASRLQCRSHLIQPYNPQHASIAPEPLSYRNNSLSSYQLPLRAYYGVQPYDEFVNENVDYELQGSSFQLIGPDHLGTAPNYANSAPGRGWTPTPAPQLPRNALFLEQDSSYTHGQLSYHSIGYPLRPNISPESRSLSLSGMSTSLPAPITGNDRVLPYPATNRTVQNGSFVRSSESMIPGSHSEFSSYNGLMSTNFANSLKSIKNHSVSENGGVSTAYLAMSSSSPESVSSSHMTYTPGTLSSSQQNTEVYTPSSEVLFPGHSNHSSENMSYITESSNEQRSQRTGSQSTPEHAENSLPPPPTNGNLSNGRGYTPYISPSIYPPPPMAPSMDTGISALAPRRLSNLQAA